MNKEPLFGKTLKQLTAVAEELGLPKFTAKQMCDWLYKKNASDISQMSNLSKNARAALENNYCVGRTAPLNVVTSAIDGTKKYLFRATGGYIETAYIPDAERSTLCVSSQVGCKMGCKFCMTGRQGFSANLTAGEILNQMASIEEGATLTNIVYMGMGEPLDNLDNVLASIEILTSDWGYGWSPRRITVSTIGVSKALDTFMQSCEAHLAVSLHNAISAERLAIMPAEKAFPAQQTVETLRKYNWNGQRRLSFEYTLLAGQNDSPAHVKAIAQLLNGLRCRINIIGFNNIPDTELGATPEAQMVRFRDALNAKGFTATIRHSKGGDIEAACGLLSTLEKQKSEA